jgi:homoserine dehydrogenase
MDVTLTVGLLGCGTVGSGVVRLLEEHAEVIAVRAGAHLAVGPVAVRDLDRRRDVAPGLLTDDPEKVVGDPDVDIVVEVMGGIDPAYRLIVSAIQAGKSVVTANKTLIAARGAELSALARERGVRLEYEAAVAGGVPIIKPMRESLAGDRVRKVLGILNGTTNYILTRMTDDGTAFEAALAEAQRLGYAEADPTADVSGADAAAKTAILASIAFNTDVTAADVYTEGITRITPVDIAHARRMGYVIKLLGIAEQVDGRVGVRVHPALVPVDHPLANVRDAYNAVFVIGDAAGSLMFYGRGAGSLPTASAVVGDVVTVARALLSGERAPWPAETAPPVVRPFDDTLVQSYLLLDVVDAPGVLAGIAAEFGAKGVSIRSMWQEGEGETAQLLFITHAAREGDVRATLDAVRALPTVRDVAGVLRVEGSEV